VRLNQRVTSTRVRNAQAEAAKRQKEAERAAKAEAKAAAKAEAAKVRAAEKAAAKEIAIAEKTARHQQRIEERQARWRQNFRNRHFQQEARARIAADKRADSQAQRMRERTAGRIMGGAARIGGAGRAALAGAGLAATAAMGSAVLDRASFDSQVRKVVNAGFDPSKHGTREGLAARIKGKTAGINKSSGMEESEVLRGLSSGIGISGDLDGMLGALADLEKVASGTGSDMGDIGETFGTLLKSFEGMPDAAERAKDMLYTLAGQGDLGAVELKDMATQGSKLAGSVVGIGGDKTHNLRTMSALMQLSRVSGATSAEEAGTAITALKSDLTRSAGALDKKHGIKVFDANGQMNDPRQVLADIISKIGNDPAAMNKIFQEQSRKSVAGLVDISQRAGGGEAGKSAIAEFFRTKDAQSVSAGAMDERAAFVAGGADRQWGRATGDFNREVGDKLLPALTKLIDPVSRLTPYMVQLADAAAKAAEWLAENPFKGLGIVVGAKIGEEIVAAKVGDAIRSAIEGNAPGASGAGAVPGAAVGKGGGWKSLASAGVIGAAVAGAADFGTGLYNAEDKTEFLGKKLSSSKTLSDVAGVTGISSIPGLGNFFQALQIGNAVAGAVDSEAATKEQGGGLSDAVKDLSAKIESMFSDKASAATVKLDPDSVNAIAGAVSTSATAANRYTAVTGTK
jgi:hypothetical protein